MGFVPTLLGGVIGAAAGIGVQVLVEAVFMRQAPWIAVIIGLATGLGVRMFTKAKHPGASYLRGAIAGLIALGAMLLGEKTKELAFSKQSAAAAAAIAKTSVSGEGDKDAEAGDDQDAVAADASKADGESQQRPSGNGPILDQIGRGRAETSVWQFASMAIGAFLAYEFARGSNAPTVAAPPEPMGGGTDPSN